MTHSDSSAHGSSATSSGSGPFPPAEWEALRRDDYQAACAIVGLMAGIFLLGVIGYIGICFWVA